jgi:hypothetical protein
MNPLSSRKYSFQGVTQFSHWSNVLNPRPSNPNGFLLRDACVSSTHLNWPVWNKQSLSAPCYTYFAGTIEFKTKPISKRNNELDPSLSNTDVFLSRDKCVSSTQLNMPVWYKQSLTAPRETRVAELFLSKLPQFSQENNVLDAPASKKVIFLSRHICFFNLAA